MQGRQPVPYFQSGNPETDEYLASYTFLNGTQYPYPGMLGMEAEYDQGSPGARNICRYVLVLAIAGQTPTKGQVLYWSNKGANTVTTAVANGNLAGIMGSGVAGAGATVAASAFWMIVRGDRPVLFLAAPTSAPAAGKPVVASATAGQADCLANAPAQGAFPLIGVALGAAVANLGSVRINIPDRY